MPNLKVPYSELKRIADRWNSLSDLTISDACKKMKINRRTLKRRLEAAKKNDIPINPPTNETSLTYGVGGKPQPPGIILPELPDDDLPVEEIISMRMREFEQKKKHEEATKLIPVHVTIPGPVGILHFGDPHVDDDGTDLGQLMYHAELTRKVPGLYGANVGDTTNNWVGRLARLYGMQNMGRARALKVAEHFLKSGNWMYMIGGNHDLWSGDDDPLKWIINGMPGMYRPSEIRLQLNFPLGEPIRINARHDFAGHSQWNPSHALMKAFMMGYRDHLFVAGHRHESAYSLLKDPDTGITGHMLRVASYKIYDRYAKEKGFRDQSLGPCAVTVFDPEKADAHPDRIKVFWDADEGVEYLNFKRRKY